MRDRDDILIWEAVQENPWGAQMFPPGTVGVIREDLYTCMCLHQVKYNDGGSNKPDKIELEYRGSPFHSKKAWDKVISSIDKDGGATLVTVEIKPYAQKVLHDDDWVQYIIGAKMNDPIAIKKDTRVKFTGNHISQMQDPDIAQYERWTMAPSDPAHGIGSTVAADMYTGQLEANISPYVTDDSRSIASADLDNI